jgi:hypothetical protein
MSGLGQIDLSGGAKTAVLILVGLLVAFLVIRILLPKRGTAPRAILTLT